MSTFGVKNRKKANEGTPEGETCLAPEETLQEEKEYSRLATIQAKVLKK